MLRMLNFLLFFPALLFISCDDNYGSLNQKCYPDGTCNEGLECDLTMNRCDEGDSGDSGNSGDTGNTGNTGGIVEEIWTKQFGSKESDFCNGMFVNNGAVCIVGVAGDDIDGFDDNEGSGDVLVACLNGDGAITRKRMFGTDKWDQGTSIAADNFGNYYVAGETMGSLSEGYDNQGQYDAFLMKMHNASYSEWINQWGTNGMDTGSGLVVDSEGFIYVCGEIDSDDGCFLKKFSSSGKEEWTTNWGGNEGCYCNSVSIDSGNNLYAAGKIFIKIDSNGNVIWEKTIEAPSYEVAIENDNSIFVAGTELRKFNSNGDNLWTYSNSDVGAVDFDNNGNIYATGYEESLHIIKIDSSGSELWKWDWGNSYTYPRGIAVYSNYIYIAGNTLNSLSGNENSGKNDVFITKMRIK